MVKLSAEQKKLLAIVAAIIGGIVAYQFAMVFLFKQPAPIKELEPFLAFLGSATIAVLVGARIKKDLT